MGGNASLIAQSLKNQPAMQESAGYAGDPGSIPESRRSPGEGNGNLEIQATEGRPMFYA